MAPLIPLQCLFCEEPFAMGDDLARHLIASPDGPRLAHEECAIRQLFGGLNHLLSRCTCCGGTEPPDPPGMSRRAAARAAAEFWRSRQK